MRQFQTEENVDGEAAGKKIFASLFEEDIKKQAALEDLWSDERPPPRPLSFDEALKSNDRIDAPFADQCVLGMQKVPTVAGDATGFVKAVAAMYLPGRRELIGESVFSKDDPISMNFVHC